MPLSLVRSFFAEHDFGSPRPAVLISRQYLVPFFRALGWEDGLPPFPMLVVDEGSSAPSDAIRHLLRDALSAEMSVAVVTDFAHLEIYDLSTPPLTGMDPLVPEHYAATEFAAQWFELVARLSPSGWPARDMRPVVAAVLGDLIRGWRLILGRSLCREHHFLSDEDLNLSVQRTINLLLLTLHDQRNPNPFAATLVDDRVGLQQHLISMATAFIDPVRVTPPFWPGDMAVIEVMRHLFYPDCPISFRLVSPEALAMTFDSVLSVLLVAEGSTMTEQPNRLITAVEGAAVVPDRMLRTVAEIALLPLLRDRSKSEMAALRIVDPSCGTGRLLIAACRLLLSAGLTQPEVLSVLSGVEQDPCQAEVAVLLLVLTALGHASPTPPGPAVTPEIMQGNPLVGPDFILDPLVCLLSRRRLRRLAPFDWSTFPGHERGFNAVLTSVPVARTRLFQGEDTYLPGHYTTFQTGGDRSTCLVERMMPMIAAGGAITILFADHWLRADRSVLFRTWLAGQRMHLIADVPALPLVGTDDHLCLLRVGSGRPALVVDAAILEGPLPPDPAGAIARTIHPILVADLSSKAWVLEDRRYTALIERLAAEGRPLDDLLLGGIVDGTPVSHLFPASQRRQVIRWDRRIRPLCRPVVAVDRPYAPPIKKGYCLLEPDRPLPERVVRQLQRGGLFAAGSARDARFCQGPKILCAVGTGTCTLDHDGACVPGPGTVALITTDLFLLGWLNSSIGVGLLLDQQPGKEGDLQLNADLLSRVRVRVPDCYDSAEQGLHDQVVTLVSRLLLQATSGPASSAGYRGSLFERIDWCIRTLYGISEEEAALLKQ